MKATAWSVCAALLAAAVAASPAHADITKWYVGGGLGYGFTSDNTNSISQELASQSPSTSPTTITKDTSSLMYKVFLGYQFTSFIAVEASAFTLGKYGADTQTSPTGSFDATYKSWGGSIDLLGIIPLGDHWRLFGKVGGVYTQNTAEFNGSGAVTVTTNKVSHNSGGWKVGAGAGYEFDSGVAFRLEWEQYHLTDPFQTGQNPIVNTVVGSALYRFK